MFAHIFVNFCQCLLSVESPVNANMYYIRCMFFFGISKPVKMSLFVRSISVVIGLVTLM